MKFPFKFEIMPQSFYNNGFRKMNSDILSILSNDRLSILKKYTKLYNLHLEALDRGYHDLADEYLMTVINMTKNNPTENLSWTLSKLGQIFYTDDKNRIIVFHEKHDERYCSFKNKNEISKICLSILQQRLDMGYYENTKNETEKQQLDLFKSNVVQLTQFEKAQNIINVAQSDNGFLYAGRLAFYFLDKRKGHEYENFSIIYLE